MLRSLVALTALAAAASAVAAPVNYTIDASHTFPRFEVNHLGMSNHSGMFNRTTGKVMLDVEAKRGSVDLAVQTASFNSGGEALDKHLRSPDFLDVEKFPTMTFKSSNFRFDGTRVTVIEGELTLLGVTKPLTLNVTNFNCGPHPRSKKDMCGANAVGSIKRSDFGMKFGIPAVGDEVKISIQIEAYKD